MALVAGSSAVLCPTTPANALVVEQSQLEAQARYNYHVGAHHHVDTRLPRDIVFPLST